MRARPIRQLSFAESIGHQSDLTHLVINHEKTTCYDSDGDGSPEGVTIVIEPRDADERLVTTAGDIFIAAYEPTVTAQQTDFRTSVCSMDNSSSKSTSTLSTYVESSWTTFCTPMANRPASYDSNTG